MKRRKIARAFARAFIVIGSGALLVAAMVGPLLWQQAQALDMTREAPSPRIELAAMVQAPGYRFELTAPDGNTYIADSGLSLADCAGLVASVTAIDLGDGGLLEISPEYVRACVPDSWPVN